MTNVLVTFSEAIKTNSVSPANFVLTFNGTAISTFQPALTVLSSNEILVGNLSAVTGTAGTYQLIINLGGISDLAGNINPGAAVAMSWQNVASGSPPVITQVPNTTVHPGATLQISVAATDPQGTAITFSLGAGAPSGVTITGDGLLTWTPTCDQGTSSNRITVWATDTLSPPLSSAMSFAVLVGDCGQFAVGSTIAQVGTIANVPFSLAASPGITNLSFGLSYPANRFTNWAITASNLIGGSATARQLNSSRANFTIGATAGSILQGTTLSGAISFMPLPGTSAFVPLAFTNILGAWSNGSSLAIAGITGRVVVISAQPLLETQPGANSNILVTLYGNPGASYEISYTTNLSAPTWLAAGRVPMTNLWQTFSFDIVLPQSFYRAAQFFADPPILDVNPSTSSPISLLLYGLRGTAYHIAASTDLSPHADWQTITNLTLTNSFNSIYISPPTNPATFLRAFHY